MQKIQDIKLAESIAAIIKKEKDVGKAADQIVELFRTKQDASGLKVCQH